MALVAHIADLAAKQVEIERLINNPLEFERRLSQFTSFRPTEIRLSDMEKYEEEEIIRESMREEHDRKEFENDKKYKQ